MSLLFSAALICANMGFDLTLEALNFKLLNDVCASFKLPVLKPVNKFL